MKPMKRSILTFQSVLMVALMLTAQLAPAASDNEGPANKLVIQVSTSDELTQKLALNNASNMLKEYGQDNIAIEVVAYGPGLSLLTDKSTQKQRVASLAMQDITFSACGNTMKNIAKKTGAEPVLIDGVQVVPAGVKRIMELQQQGYAYIRP